MRELKFKYIKAEDFICFENIEINFEDYGNIVVVKGRNLDVNEQEGEKASNGSGKCFGKDTQILMHDGTIKMVQDVKAGEFVMGHDSKPREVLSLTCGRERLYEVVPTKGSSYIVNHSHILSLKSSDKKYDRYKNHYSKNGNVYNISVKDYLNESKSYKRIMHGYRASVEFSKKELVIDPYFLGLWLGDGTRDESAITNIDKVVVKEIKREAAKRSLKVNLNFNKNKTCYKDKLLRKSTVWRWIQYAKNWIKSGKKLPKVNFGEIKLHEMNNSTTRNSLFNDLKFLNLLNNKHIPLVYKTSSKEDRLQLLAGFLDTDGHYQNGGYEFTSKFKQLAEDVAYVARSVGLACYVSKTKKSSQNGTVGVYYRAFISGECSVIPVKINYKKSSKRKINKDPLIVGIKLKELGVGNYYGFSLKGSPLFLLGDFTVVHNSSLPEIIVYALYGKTIKKPTKLTHLNLINNKSKKLSVEVRWDDYRVVRKRDSNNKGTVQLWKSDKGQWNKETEITKAGRGGVQGEIENLIGLTYESFINIFVFSDDNTLPFLECDNTKKREIVENILSLEKYRGYSENAKEMTKDLKTKIKDLAKEYEFLQSQHDACITHIAQIEKQELDWRNEKNKELNGILNQVKEKRDELEKSKTGAALSTYQEAQDQIVDLKVKIPVLEAEKTKINEVLTDVNNRHENAIIKFEGAKNKTETLKSEYQHLQKVIVDNKKLIEDKTSQVGKPCPYCLGDITENNFANVIKKVKEFVEVNEPLSFKKKAEYDLEFVNYEKFSLLKTKIEEGISCFKNKLNNVNTEIAEVYCTISELSKVPRPESDLTELLLADQIENLKKEANKKHMELKGATPFDVIKQTAITDLNQRVQDCQTKKNEIKQSEDLVPFYEFWVKAFGDNGIRKYIIDGIIPTLNERIEYWLQFLIDNKIKLTFDNKLDETIDRYPFNGRPYVYHGLSGGQRRRLNLTAAAAWAFVSELNSGASPSQIWLDEVTMNVDTDGVLGIYRMICELAKEKKVFVIDHNEQLLGMLDGCDTIQLEMKDEVSKKVDMFRGN